VTKCNVELKSGVNNFPKLPYGNLHEVKSLNLGLRTVGYSLEMEQVSDVLANTRFGVVKCESASC
jgi:hypothetical protein